MWLFLSSGGFKGGFLEVLGEMMLGGIKSHDSWTS